VEVAQRHQEILQAIEKQEACRKEDCMEPSTVYHNAGETTIFYAHIIRLIPQLMPMSHRDTVPWLATLLENLCSSVPILSIPSLDSPTRAIEMRSTALYGVREAAAA
jgi:hypothetical protein